MLNNYSFNIQPSQFFNKNVLMPSCWIACTLDSRTRHRSAMGFRQYRIFIQPLFHEMIRDIVNFTQCTHLSSMKKLTLYLLKYLILIFTHFKLRLTTATHNFKCVKITHIHYTILYYTILYYTILYYTILYYTILYYTILYYTILYYTILYYTILYCTVLYCAVLCCAVLCCAVMCCAVLCCAVLCCAVLYCTVLYCTVTYFNFAGMNFRLNPIFLHFGIF